MKFNINLSQYFSGGIGADCARYGQVIGLLMPHALSSMFPHLTLITVGKVVGVVDINSGKRYKVFTGDVGRFDMLPSFAKGIGRVGTYVDIDNCWKEFDGYIFINTGNLSDAKVEVVVK